MSSRGSGSGRTCWASPLGGCGGGISGEHIISASLFRGPRITVSGFPWQLTGSQEIGLSALTANILCERHNAALSDVDAAGGEAFRLLGEIVDGWRQDLANPPSPTRTIEYEIDGRKLERWFLKSTINIMSIQRDPRPTPPPTLLIKAAFGMEQLENPVGLYGAQVRDPISPSPMVKFAGLFAPLSPTQDALAAALFGFRDFRFALWLLPQPPDATLIEEAPDWRVTNLLRHPGAIEFRVAGNVTRRLLLRWS